MKLLPAVLIGLAASAALADPAGQVRCREIAFSVAVETKNRSLFASFIDKDARFVGSSVMRGPAAIAEAWSIFFADDAPRIKWRPQFVEVLENGELACILHEGSRLGSRARASEGRPGAKVIAVAMSFK